MTEITMCAVTFSDVYHAHTSLKITPHIVISVVIPRGPLLQTFCRTFYYDIFSAQKIELVNSVTMESKS